VEVHLFDFGVGSHHELSAPEKNREHSIADQQLALNVGFMERIPGNNGRAGKEARPDPQCSASRA
ncbi:hypothetical protein, partial [Pseudomonas proteolytica]|uniref:hypothetical protein n=1 Tax=Pseudomonas proteolytica TaxID=219574 RepID=UPI001CB72853